MNYRELKKHLDNCKTESELLNKIVNLPFEYRLQSAQLLLGIISLVFVNQKTGTIDRIALSETEFANNVKNISIIDFKDIKIDINSKENITAAAIRDQRPKDTTDWNDLLVPVIS